MSETLKDISVFNIKEHIIEMNDLTQNEMGNTAVVLYFHI